MSGKVVLYWGIVELDYSNLEEWQEVNGKMRLLKSPPHWTNSVPAQSAGSDLSRNGFSLDLGIDLSADKTNTIKV